MLAKSLAVRLGTPRFSGFRPLLLIFLAYIANGVYTSATGLFSWFCVLRARESRNEGRFVIYNGDISSKLYNPVLTAYFQKWANAGPRCWAADQHLLRSYKRFDFECNRDPKHSKVRCLELRVSPVVYDPPYNFHLFITFEAPILGAASTARACSRVALRCDAACLSANTF